MGDKEILTSRGTLLRRERSPASKHQPRKAEQEEEIDMPGASRGAVRGAFFQSFKRRPLEAK